MFEGEGAAELIRCDKKTGVRKQSRKSKQTKPVTKEHELEDWNERAMLPCQSK